MVELRKNFTFILVLWVACGPLMLSWHYALDHVQGASGKICCDEGVAVNPLSANSCSDSLPCPFQNRSANAVEQIGVDVTDSSDCSSEENCSEGCCPDNGEDSCRICELLLHDDLIAVEWYELTFSDRIALAEAELAIRNPVAEIVSAWSVRGPPKNC